jgi:NADH:ubiquinone oxidoreductase subunit E
MQRINVTICSGPACCVPSAAHLKQLELALSPKLKSQICLRGVHCPGACAAGNTSCAPRVEVNGHLLLRATPAEVVRAIREQLGETLPHRLVA